MRTYVLREGIRVQTAVGQNHPGAWAIGNAVIEADGGIWLATWDCQTLEPLLDEANQRIPVPQSWQEVVAYEMFPEQGTY